VLAVVNPGRGRAGGERVAEQRAPAAPDIEQSIARPQLERAEDRTAREVVNVLGAVGVAGSSAGGAPCDAIGQPIIERPLGQAAALPGAQVVVPEAECARECQAACR